MKASKGCLKCPWKTDVGSKYVCMFKWCVYKKFDKNKKQNDENYYTPDWQFQQSSIEFKPMIHID